MARTPAHAVMHRLLCADALIQDVGRNWLRKNAELRAVHPENPLEVGDLERVLESTTAQALFSGQCYYLTPNVYARIVDQAKTKNAALMKTDVTLDAVLLPHPSGVLYLDDSAVGERAFEYDLLTWNVSVERQDEEKMYFGNGVDLENDDWTLDITFWSCPLDNGKIRPLGYFGWHRGYTPKQALSPYSSHVTQRDKVASERALTLLGSVYMFWATMNVLHNGEFVERVEETEALRMPSLQEYIPKEADRELLRKVTVVDLENQMEQLVQQVPAKPVMNLQFWSTAMDFDLRNLPSDVAADILQHPEQRALMQRIWSYIYLTSPTGQEWIDKLAKDNLNKKISADPSKTWREFVELSLVAPVLSRAASFVPYEVVERIMRNFHDIPPASRITLDMLPDMAGFVMFDNPTIKSGNLCVSWSVVSYELPEGMSRSSPEMKSPEQMVVYRVGAPPDDSGRWIWALQLVVWLSNEGNGYPILGGTVTWPDGAEFADMLELDVGVKSPQSIGFVNDGLRYFWHFCNMHHNNRIAPVEAPSLPYILEGFERSRATAKRGDDHWVLKYELDELDHVLVYDRARYQLMPATHDTIQQLGSDFSVALEQMYGFHHWLTTPPGKKLMKNSIVAAGDDDKIREMVYQATLGVVRRASPYYWSPEMCDFLMGTVQSMPTWTLMRDLLPSEMGYMWFDKPLYLPAPDDMPGYEKYSLPDDIIALYWYPYDYEVTHDAVPVGSAQGIILQYLMRTPSRLNGQPGVILQWGIGETNDHLYEKGMSEHPRHMKQTEITNQRLRLQLDYFAAAMSLMNQVIDMPPTRVSRPAYRRLERSEYADIAPDVRVVALRRRRYKQNPLGGGSDVAWNYRWLVRGHWRQQYYPKTNSHAPIWISPFVKGPEDAPLKPTTKLFAVVQ